MLSLSDARALIVEHTPPLPGVICSLSEALGRTLRQDVHATEPIPSFDCSAMDGYAIGAGEGETFDVVGEITPGRPAPGEIRPGECFRIFTGAAVPAGALRVIPQEWTQREGDTLRFTAQGSQSFIRKQGENAAIGENLLASGARLGAGEISLLAQAGVTRPTVSRACRVAHIVTGDELVNADDVPSPGKIRDSNSYLVAALLAQAGSHLISQSRCTDDADLLYEKVDHALENRCDMLLLSGGASVGDYDFGLRVLERLGFSLHFTKVDIRPGKPLVFGTREGVVAFVIPGNPVSHFVTFQVAIRAAIECLGGRVPSWPLVPVRLGAEIPPQRDPRETYWPAQLKFSPRGLIATPLAWQSSGDLRGLVGARALIQIRPGSGPLEIGSTVPCLLLNEE